jgi:ribonuclease HI
MEGHISVYTDGASRKNPGPSASGFAVYVGGKLLREHAEYNGIATNNYAEYRAVILALEWCASNMQDREIELYADSQIVIRQVNGSYKTKSASLKPMNDRVRSLAKKFKSIKFSNLSREDKRISRVDKNLNILLDSLKE